MEPVLIHLEIALENLLSLRSTNRDVHGNLLVAPDAELADGVAGLGPEACLAVWLLENFRGSGQTVTTHQTP